MTFLQRADRRRAARPRSCPSVKSPITRSADNTGAPKSRAEVQAELVAAIASGQRYAAGEDDFVAPQPAAPGPTQAQVRGELLAAIANGEHRFYGEEGETPAVVFKAERVFARSQARENLTVSAK